MLALLEKAGAKEKGLPPAPRKPAAYKPDAREAIRRASELLAKSSETFFPAGGGCMGCHHQPFAGRAFGAMKAVGLPAEPRLRQILLDGMAAERPFHVNRLPLLIMDGGKIDTLLYPLAAWAEMGEPASQFTDLIVHYAAATQDPSGAWHEQFTRPPLQESSITRTMLAISALKNYGWPARRAEFDERIARARAWLETAPTWTTVDEADRITGLSLGGADRAGLEKFGQKLDARATRRWRVGTDPVSRVGRFRNGCGPLLATQGGPIAGFGRGRISGARNSFWIRSFRMDPGTCEAAR